jgi:hypothetical protein
MTRTTTAALSLTLLLSLASCTGLEDLNSILEQPLPTTSSALTNEEVIQGLKEALKQGAERSVELAAVEDGFYKNAALYIPFPEEAQKVKQTALDVGFDAQVERFERTLNRAAEEAAKEAAPIFIDAIMSMTIQDGFNILNGADNAATEYLRNRTSAQLRQKFSPKVEAAIEKVELTKYWQPLITKYNAVNFLTGGDDINPDLNAYVTERAIEGLFIHVAAEEKRIRENPEARVTAILQKVFGQ